ncbi:hypothetical protein SpCBS45565_g03822 [Spizellomyces sp. 'palustris']|nr:hypothetical protein SpCBS45565_g03822 [Spizellomyces sp. 'palustris']
MYVKQRAQDGYRSRAAYKLEEVQKRFGLIRKGMVVLDLGGCPGGWAQVAVKYAIRKDSATGGTHPSSTLSVDGDKTVSTRPKLQGKVISIDLLPIDPIPNVQILTGDMCDPMILDNVCTLVHGSQDVAPQDRTGKDAVDVVLSDMAHPFTGSRTADVARVLELCQVALRVAETPGILKRGGGFVCKFFQGEGEQALPGLSTLLPWSTLPPAPLQSRSPQSSSPISHTWPEGQPTTSQCLSPPLSAVRPHPASPVRIPWNQHHIPHTFPPHTMPLSPPNSQPHSYGSAADCASSCSSSVGSYSDTASPTMTPRDQQPIEESGVEIQNGQTEEGGGKAPKSYLCPICSRPFSRMYNLRTHIERHSIRRTFECDLCPAKFSRSHDLARHRLTHTQERPYTCERCGRRFARRDALRRHDKVDPVTGQKVCAAEGRPKGSGKKRQVNADTTA